MYDGIYPHSGRGYMGIAFPSDPAAGSAEREIKADVTEKGVADGQNGR